MALYEALCCRASYLHRQWAGRFVMLIRLWSGWPCTLSGLWSILEINLLSRKTYFRGEFVIYEQKITNILSYIAKVYLKADWWWLKSSKQRTLVVQLYRRGFGPGTEKLNWKGYCRKVGESPALLMRCGFDSRIDGLRSMTTTMKKEPQRFLHRDFAQSQP